MSVKDLNLHFEEMITLMTRNAKYLFETAADPDVLWNLYLDSFPAGTNEIYRKRREYDCSCCRHFIKHFGHIVSIEGGKITSIWDRAECLPDPFHTVAKAMSEYIHSLPVKDVYYTTSQNIGTPFNYEEGTGIRWEHLHVTIPSAYVCRRNVSEGEFKRELSVQHAVFKRSLDEITPDAVDTVLELIDQNTLYRGEEWRGSLTHFRYLQDGYSRMSEPEKDLYAWKVGTRISPTVAMIRNHSIGTLLVDLSEGADLEGALRKYEFVVAPTNYKRPKAVFTAKMVEAAQKKITELGHLDSLPRRHARLDDISVNNILFSNRDAQSRMKDADDVFAAMKSSAAKKPKDFSRVEEISAEDFVEKVLPTAKEVEAYIESRHASNMVSLIAPGNADAPSMFKWNNGFGWAYAGNIADSNIKQNVAKAGGNVDGVLRFSIQWNDNGELDRNDLDAHCDAPDGHIYYANRHTWGGGALDVDIIHPAEDVPAVENITWADITRMTPGRYTFYVHCFSNRGGRSGFRAEIAFAGETYSFDHTQPLRCDEEVLVADVVLDQNKNFSIEFCEQPVSSASVDVWNLKTNSFVPVSTIMYSPNYWDEQEGNGNRHYFFMLKDCINPEEPNGFYNEFLKNELLEHKRVFEALGSRMRVAHSDDQLSGVGFSSTKRGELIVRVTGATRRVLKIKF